MHEKSEWSSLSYLRYTALIKPSEAGIWVWIIGEGGMGKRGGVHKGNVRTRPFSLPPSHPTSIPLSPLLPVTNKSHGFCGR